VKRLLVLPVLMVLVFTAAPVLAQDSDFRADYGALNGRRYVNGYFGFSYRFPEGWAGSALRSPALGESRMYPLFAGNPQDASTTDLRYLSINADYLVPNTVIKTPKDFLEAAINPQAGPSGPFEVLSLRSDKRFTTYGGKQFYRVDMRSKPTPGNPVFYQTQICILLKSYAITFSFMAANSDDMDDLVRTMESLTFFEPGLMANAPARPVAIQPQTQAEPTVVATISTPPAPPTTTMQAPSAVLPAGTTENRAAETQSRPTPAKTTSRKTAAAEVSSAASEVPTAEVSLSTVASSTPDTVAVQTAAESGMVASAPVTSFPVSTASNTTRTAPATQRSVTPATANTSAPTRQTAPSTVIQAAHAPARATYETPAATRTQAPSTVIGHPAAQPVVVSTPRAEPTPTPVASTPAPAPSYTPPPTARPAPTPAYVTASAATTTTTTAAVQAPAPVVSQPVTQPVMEPPRAEPTPTPIPTPTPTVTAAMNTPPPPISTPSTPSAGAPMRVHVSAAVLDEYVTHKSQPLYPLIAKTAGVEGMVVLDIIVDGRGGLQEVKVVSGPALLVRGAEEAVRQWRFKPYIVDGNAVEMESQVSMNFRLR
jgi:protein TonB